MAHQGNYHPDQLYGKGLIQRGAEFLGKGTVDLAKYLAAGYTEAGGILYDALGKAVDYVKGPHTFPQETRTAILAGRAAPEGLSEVSPTYPPLAVAQPDITPAHMQAGEPSVNTYSAPAIVAPLGEPTLMERGPDYMRASETKGDYEEEGGFKFDQKKWNDTLAGLAALAPPKDLPTPTLNLNQIQARTVQGGGGQRTPFNPDAIASTAFQDRTTAPQILKFLR